MAFNEDPIIILVNIQSHQHSAHKRRNVQPSVIHIFIELVGYHRASSSKSQRTNRQKKQRGLCANDWKEPDNKTTLTSFLAWLHKNPPSSELLQTPPGKRGKFGKHRHRGIFDQCKPPYSGYHLPTNGLEQTLIILIQRLVNVLYLGDSIHITFLRYLLEMMLPIVGWWLGHLPSPWFFGDDCQSCPQQSPSPSPVTVGHDTIPCPGAYLRKNLWGFRATRIGCPIEGVSVVLPLQGHARDGEIQGGAWSEKFDVRCINTSSTHAT